MKVLLVDDHRQIREIIKKFLIKLPINIKIYECEDGEEAVKIFHEEKPDLILMDIIMKKLDGLAVTRRIHLTSPEAIIIVISQLPEQEYRQEALDAGAVDYLNKENLNELPQLIEKYIQKNK